MSCPFCGMPPRDGQSCCTREFQRDVMRRADREIKSLRTALAAAQAERDARARSELEDLRDWCEEQRDDWKREADRAPAKIVAASCAMAAGSFGTVMEEIGNRLAALTPQPTPGAESPKQPSARDGAKEG